MSQEVKSVVIVGGGSAGWITAGLLARKLKSHSADGIKITLIESSDVPTIGVGEGTWPTMRLTLKKIGISETEFLRYCDASFKQGSKFVNWVDGRPNDFYYHPFTPPRGFDKIDLTPYWVDQQDQRSDFANAVCFQPTLCEAGLAPKKITDPEYQAMANYGYHLDAGRFAEFLKKYCKKELGIHHIVDHVLSVEQEDNGLILSLTTRNKGKISGDFFIDCSGFAALLIGQTLNVPYISRHDVLFTDRALAIQVPYENEDENVMPCTISMAHDAGWTWDIGLTNRRGIGYVYSSDFVSDDKAEETLRHYVGALAKDSPVKKIKYQSGHRQKFWHKNCVAIGLSAGFLEPLEASALMLIETSVNYLAEQFPYRRDMMPLLAARFNKAFSIRWDQIIDFLKLHYVLSRRTDPFWQAHREASTIPDNLQQLLSLWRHQFPNSYDYDGTFEVFPTPSYQYILYGMGYETDISQIRTFLKQHDMAQKYFILNRKTTDELQHQLPSHRALLKKVRDYGFQSI